MVWYGMVGGHTFAINDRIKDTLAIIMKYELNEEGNKGEMDKEMGSNERDNYARYGGK